MFNKSQHPPPKSHRELLQQWQNTLSLNYFDNDVDFKHSINYYFGNNCSVLINELNNFAAKITSTLDKLAIKNNLSNNLPSIEYYDGIGNLNERIIHHPDYTTAGDIIYGSQLLKRLAKPGGLLEAMTFMYLSSHVGEAGHNCPLACSAGIIRVLQKVPDFPQKTFYLQKLLEPSYTHNFTGAQFLTEIQGGSDVGQNATLAYQDETGDWRIFGEKWFCSNANAELILMTARFDEKISGTKGLGLFLVPALLESGEKNHYHFRRLKDKIGTRSMASAEIDFNDAYAICMGAPEDGFKLVMENVLHLSRIFNSFCMLGMAKRAYQIAFSYAQFRVAFGQAIVNYPLVKENLAQIKAENTAMLAAICHTTQLQDKFDRGELSDEKTKLLLRLLANLNKHISALWSVEHIHHALDVLAGNGAIESFSIIPRLFRDSIVCENWEGTHNTLCMQILKDITRYKIAEIFIEYLELNIKTIDCDEKYKTILQSGVTKLTAQLIELANSASDLQSLQIKNIVMTMAVLLCTFALLQEAVHQDKSGVQSKKHCLDYFILLHLNDKKIEYNQAYLDIISEVLK